MIAHVLLRRACVSKENKGHDVTIRSSGRAAGEILAVFFFFLSFKTLSPSRSVDGCNNDKKRGTKGGWCVSVPSFSPSTSLPWSTFRSCILNRYILSLSTRRSFSSLPLLLLILLLSESTAGDGGSSFPPIPVYSRCFFFSHETILLRIFFTMHSVASWAASRSYPISLIALDCDEFR